MKRERVAFIVMSRSRRMNVGISVYGNFRKAKTNRYGNNKNSSSTSGSGANTLAVIGTDNAKDKMKRPLGQRSKRSSLGSYKYRTETIDEKSERPVRLRSGLALVLSGSFISLGTMQGNIFISIADFERIERVFSMELTI